MKRLVVDTNVVLDVLLDRAPHAEAASRLWMAAERGECELIVPAHAVTTIHYLAARHRNPIFANVVVADLLAVFGVAPVDDAVLRRALALAWDDFEDAVVAAAAERVDAAAVVTRNLGDFDRSPVAAVDPATAVAWLRTV